MCVERNVEVRSRNRCCRGKAISITYSEHVSVAVQRAKSMRRIILPPVGCPAAPYFSTLSHTRHDFRNKKLWSIKCVFRLSLQISSKTFLILRRI
jgi:hypothetical protein